MIALVAALAAAAHADPERRVLVGADRLAPIYSYTRVSRPSGGGDSGEVDSSISLLGYDTSQTVFYTMPRLAVDVEVTDRLTVGASALVFATLWKWGYTSSSDPNGYSNRADDPRPKALGIAPRVGYLEPLTCSLSLWSRAGVSFYYQWDSGTDANSTSEHDDQLAIDVEALLLWTAGPHLALTVGPVADIPVTGGHGVGTSNSYEVEQLHVGITGGVLGWF